ncbi:MAG: HD domain-containing protein [Candidatus Veblenbacteria bacterium]|nr:HD domain-containing protein [Candidatus Veblenbacteria bacterium]
MATPELKRTIELLFEIGSLRRVQRSHLQNLGKTEDSVLDHSFRVAIIGYALATLEHCDATKVLKMCLWHDLAEARTGDQNWVHKRYVKSLPDKAVRDQFKNTPFQKEAIVLMKEYKARKTREAIIAKDADILEEVLQLKEYADQGNKEAERWIPYNIKPLKTSVAKTLAQLALKSDIHGWWWQGRLK